VNSFDWICSIKSRRLEWVGPLVLCAQEVSRVPRGIAGIYMLHAFHLQAGIYPPVYVGKSGDLRVRLFQHLESNWSTSSDIIALRSRFRIYFSAAPVLDAQERDGAEAALIQLLRPRCNRQVPPMLTVIPNLPPLTVRF
jgi:hypothetical protein